MKKCISILLLSLSLHLYAQKNTLPYYEIPDAPNQYTAGGVAARLIDGLGFRFYWSTEELREEDLRYKPGTEARTCEETIRHIYEMSFMIVNATTQTVNTRDKNTVVQFAEMRKRVLENLKTASDNLRNATDEEFENYKILFRSGDTLTELPFWNLLNGPIADCLWHVGQVVSFRRASGNPFSSKVDVFTGTVNE